MPEEEPQDGGATGGSWAGGQLVVKLEEPGREKRVSRRNESRRQLAKSRPEVHMGRIGWVGRLSCRLGPPGVLCVHSLLTCFPGCRLLKEHRRA